MSSSRPLAMVQFRPPNLGTASVYGIRRIEPTNGGIATSRKSEPGSKLKPAAGRLTTTMLHSDQTEKPRFSTKIEKARLRQATRRPVRAQKLSSSGRQSAIQRRRSGAAAAPGLTATVWGGAWTSVTVPSGLVRDGGL